MNTRKHIFCGTIGSDYANNPSFLMPNCFGQKGGGEGDTSTFYNKNTCTPYYNLFQNFFANLL